MIKNDKWIAAAAAAERPLITPFVDELISRHEGGNKIISYGLSSFGYDIRLSSKELFLFNGGGPLNHCIDPKSFSPSVLTATRLHTDADEEGNVIGKYFILPPHSYALAVSAERFIIPQNISVLCIGKSTYARCGIIANLTPIEAGWEGFLTLELANTSPNSCRVYANEGIAQLIFFEGERCNIAYENRKYQDQLHSVTFAR